MTSHETLDIAIADRVATLALNRPDKANAMNAAFWRELPMAVDSLDADPAVRAIVICGRGKHFSAGIDLAMMQEMMAGMAGGAADPARQREALRRRILELQASFTALERCRKPVIAAIHGGCIGAGVDLVTACDLRYAAADTRFRVAEIDIGIVADVGTLQRAPHLLPHGVLRELAFTGRVMGAEEAQRYGFVNGIAETAEAVLEMARDTARTLAAKSPLALAGVKQVLNHARDHAVDEGLDYVATWNAGMLPGADLMAGAQAAMTKTGAAYDDLLE